MSLEQKSLRPCPGPRAPCLVLLAVCGCRGDLGTIIVRNASGPVLVAVDDTSIYWTACLSECRAPGISAKGEGNALMKARLDGRDVATVTTPFDMVAAKLAGGVFVYTTPSTGQTLAEALTDSTTLRKVSSAAGSRSELLYAPRKGVGVWGEKADELMVSGDSVYWSSSLSTSTSLTSFESRLKRISLDAGGEPTVLVLRSAFIGNDGAVHSARVAPLAVDGTDLIVLETSLEPPRLRLHRRALASDDPDTPLRDIFSQEARDWGDFRVAAGAIFIQHENSVERVPFDGSQPSTVKLPYGAYFFSTDGMRLFAWSYSDGLVVFDATTGKTLRSFDSDGHVSSVVFDANNVYWAAGSYIAKAPL